MGITENAKVEECRCHRRKNHLFMILNRLEMDIERFKENMRFGEEDIFYGGMGMINTRESSQQLKLGRISVRNIKSMIGIRLSGSSMRHLSTPPWSRLLCGMTINR